MNVGRNVAAKACLQNLETSRGASAGIGSANLQADRQGVQQQIDEVGFGAMDGFSEKRNGDAADIASVFSISGRDSNRSRVVEKIRGRGIHFTNTESGQSLKQADRSIGALSARLRSGHRQDGHCRNYDPGFPTQHTPERLMT